MRTAIHRQATFGKSGRRGRRIAIAISCAVAMIAGTGVASAVTAPPVTGLFYSATATHVSPKVLAHALISTPSIHLFVGGSTVGVVSVDYFVDHPSGVGAPTAHAVRTPFDVTLFVSRLSAGRHNVVAVATTTTRHQVDLFARFAVGAAAKTAAPVAPPVLPVTPSAPAITATAPTPGVSAGSTHGDGPQDTPPPVAATPPPVAGAAPPSVAGAPPALCTNDDVNNEPGILAGFSPGAGQSVSSGGQIKVWVNDEGVPFIAPGEQVNPQTGQITVPGDRTAKAPDGYLWEPSLYISPQSAETGGTPHFPSMFKGDVNPNPPTRLRSNPNPIPGMDAPPPGTDMSLEFKAEDIWNVDALGLSAGTYTGEFLIFDGDRDRAVGCVTITIAGGTTPVPAPVPMPLPSVPPTTVGNRG